MKDNIIRYLEAKITPIYRKVCTISNLVSFTKTIDYLQTEEGLIRIETTVNNSTGEISTKYFNNENEEIQGPIEGCCGGGGSGENLVDAFGDPF